MSAKTDESGFKLTELNAVFPLQSLSRLVVSAKKNLYIKEDMKAIMKTNHIETVYIHFLCISTPSYLIPQHALYESLKKVQTI